MNAEFYLFDVEQGQCAALYLPNGRWCIFDVGRTATFSPIEWIAANDRNSLIVQALGGQPRFGFLKSTVSHLHGDHLADYTNLVRFGPQYLLSVIPDEAYLRDCYATCSDARAKSLIRGFASHYGALGPATSPPDYGGAAITEALLPVAVARVLGGDANARVNNASIITRIDVHATSILLCGDLEKEAWEAVLADRQVLGSQWRALAFGVDILVAPHHGHKSGYSATLMNLARPKVVLASVVSKDPHVDSRYSQDPVQGIHVGENDYTLITTRKQGHIRVTIPPPDTAGSPSARQWSFGFQALVQDSIL